MCGGRSLFVLLISKLDLLISKTQKTTKKKQENMSKTPLFPASFLLWRCVVMLLNYLC